MRLVRHLLAILALPFVMVVLVPRQLLGTGAGSGWSDALAMPMGAAGAILFMAGLGLFAWCVALFARVAMAPWRRGIPPGIWWRWDPTATCATR
jgi:hypothetical protein